MDIKSLMIGDWVSIGTSKYYQVEEIRKEYGEYRFYLKGTSVFATESEIEPIPLKRIHLTKNGFKVKDAEDTTFVYMDGYKIEVIFSGNPNDPLINLSIEFAEKEVWMLVEYVHQLQQAMRLFEIEKEIEL